MRVTQLGTYTTCRGSPGDGSGFGGSMSSFDAPCVARSQL